MRTVIDTNVLVSGLLNPHGPPGRVVDAILAGSVIVLYDDRILAEYADVLARPAFGFRAADVHVLLDFLAMSGEAIRARPILAVLPDPADLPFLEVAMAGAADALVTGNARHFKPVKGRHHEALETPAAFVARLAGPAV